MAMARFDTGAKDLLLHSTADIEAALRCADVELRGSTWDVGSPGGLFTFLAGKPSPINWTSLPKHHQPCGMEGKFGRHQAELSPVAPHPQQLCL